MYKEGESGTIHQESLPESARPARKPRAAKAQPAEKEEDPPPDEEESYSSTQYHVPKELLTTAEIERGVRAFHELSHERQKELAKQR